ncbi:four helix bundle protein [Candidatus Dojkabacteria bacterium]|nr:four helix bundle protein [Candidatus Dojkabacteria bacterium]
MNKIKKLQDLNAWKESVKLAQLIYKNLKLLPRSEDYNIRKHLSSCARNIPGNIAEGFGRAYFRESKYFYHVAKGSLEEINSDVSLAYALKYFPKDVYLNIQEQIEVVGKLISGLINSTKKVKISR